MSWSTNDAHKGALTEVICCRYNIEGPGPKLTALINLVKSLLAQGIPLDCVGFEGHFIVGQVPSTFQTQLAQVAALGVEVAVRASCTRYD